MAFDVSRAIDMSSADDFDRWLRANGATEHEVAIAIYKKPSGKQTVTLVALQDTALCHGWIDMQAKRIDAERYAIRFMPRRPRSNWSPTNRAAARRLIEEGRMTAAGIAALPADLDAEP